jgi:hypothetical protein
MNDWRPLEEVGDIAYADYLVEHGIPADDEMIARLRARARPPKKEERLTDVIARELKARGWSERRLKGHRLATEWKHETGETAFSMHDALVKQIMREIR